MKFEETKKYWVIFGGKVMPASIVCEVSTDQSGYALRIETSPARYIFREREEIYQDKDVALNKLET